MSNLTSEDRILRNWQWLVQTWLNFVQQTARLPPFFCRFSIAKHIFSTVLHGTTFAPLLVAFRAICYRERNT